jgi:hypothetical protein
MCDPVLVYETHHFQYTVKSIFCSEIEMVHHSENCSNRAGYWYPWAQQPLALEDFRNLW